MRDSNQGLRIFTWHIHGSYLYYLSQGKNFQIYIPVNEEKSNHNIGRGETYPFGPNVIEVPVSDVPSLEFDCILYQHADNYTTDQFRILSEYQRTLPRIYLEHDPPWAHPTNTVHLVDDPEVLVVHVTHFNRLVWDTQVDSKVIEHGVVDKGKSYKGNIAKGIVVINNLPTRGRLLGFDIFNKVRKQVPLDLVGMGTEEYGIGEVLHPDLPAFISQYRFFFNPIRYTSFGLAVCEAMMSAIPVVALATTEVPGVIRDGVNGIASNNVDHLIDEMKLLLENKQRAIQIGEAGRETACERFNINRFVQDWDDTFRSVIKNKTYEQKNSVHQ